MFRLVANVARLSRSAFQAGTAEHDIPVLYETRDHALGGAAHILTRYPEVELKLYYDDQLVLREAQLRHEIATRSDLWPSD